MYESLIPDPLAGLKSNQQPPWVGQATNKFSSVLPVDDYTSLGSNWGQPAPADWTKGFGFSDMTTSGPGINSPLGNASPMGWNAKLQDMGVTGPNGWGSLALGAAGGLLQGYLGLQQLGLAKNQLATQKEQFNLNFGAQQKMTNERLETRQRRRNIENPNSTNVAAYMAKYGI